MKVININTQISIHESLTELDEVYQQLLVQAETAMHNAHAPYSKFKVGAAVLLKNKTIVSGNNQENASYPAGTCAEQVALNYASAQYPNIAIEAIAIQTKHPSKPQKKPSMPCGICRQAILEYEHKWNNNIVVLTRSEQGIIYQANRLTDILPFAFTKDAL